MKYVEEIVGRNGLYKIFPGKIYRVSSRTNNINPKVDKKYKLKNCHVFVFSTFSKGYEDLIVLLDNKIEYFNENSIIFDPNFYKFEILVKE